MNLLLAISVLTFLYHGSSKKFVSSASYPTTGSSHNVHHGYRQKPIMDRGRATAMVEQEQQRRDLDEKFMSQPSPCVWAILACCSPTNFHFRFGCFPYLGCTALFWETDPCQLRTVLDAATEALKFYEQFDKRPPPNTTTSPPASAPPPPPSAPPTEGTSTVNDSSPANNNNTTSTTTSTPTPTTGTTTAELSAPETTVPASTS